MSCGELSNTKINGVNIQLMHDKVSKSDVKGIAGVHVAQTEFLWWSLGLPSVMSFQFHSCANCCS